MDGMLQVTALAGAAVLCTAVVRRGAPEFAALLILAAGGCIILLSINTLQSVLAVFQRLAVTAQLEREVLQPVLKTVAISLLTKIAGELCRGAGEGGAAAFVEVAGSIFALAAALPLAQGVLELMGQLLV